MAAPSTPTHFYAQTGNRKNFLSWDVVAASPAVTQYQVQRSTDGVTFTVVASPALNQYIDTAVTTGSVYFYRVAATNADGTSAYTDAQSLVPTPTGEMTLGQIRLAAQQRADIVNSQFITLPEWNQMINQSMYELYDLLITVFEDYYVATPVQFTTDGSSSKYPLPNGENYSQAAPFYKLLGIDMGINTANKAYVTLSKFNFMNRNKYVFPNASSVIYGVFNAQYRVMGDNIEFIPTPSANQPLRIWYVPRLPQLLMDSDITSSSISGWIEYVIVDVAIKAMQKEESDVSILMAQKMALKQRIEETAANRDPGRPDTISDTRGASFWGGSGGYGDGPIGGF